MPLRNVSLRGVARARRRQVLDRDAVELAEHRQIAAARVDVVHLHDPAGAEIALRADLPARVVRDLALGRNDGADGETETRGRAERRARRLDELPAGKRIGEIGEERRAVVLGGEDRPSAARSRV